MKRILAFMLSLILCLAPATLLVMASANVNDDPGPCGHSLDDYQFTYGDGVDILVSTSDMCYYTDYPDAKEVCNLCGYSIAYPVQFYHPSHNFVDGYPLCLKCFLPK